MTSPVGLLAGTAVDWRSTLLGKGQLGGLGVLGRLLHDTLQGSLVLGGESRTEQLVGVHLVQRRLEQDAVLAKVVLGLDILDAAAELLGLFEQLQVSGALIATVVGLLLLGLILDIPVGLVLGPLVLFAVVVGAGLEVVVVTESLLAVLHGSGQSLEQLCDALQQARPADGNALRNLISLEAKQSRDGDDAELLVVDPGEVGHAAKPQAEEPVRPALGLEDVQGEDRVVVDRVDDELHEVDLVSLDLDILCSENVHGELDESQHVVVDVATEVQHHGLGQLAGANAVNATDLVIVEHVGDHGEESLDVLGLLHQLASTVLNKVVQSRQHVLQVELGAGLESSVDELESLPHGGRDALGSKCAAVNDLEHFVVEIVQLVLQGDLNDGHENSLNVQKNVGGALEGENESADGLEDAESSDALLVEVVSKLVVTVVLVLIQHFTDDTKVGVSQLLAESNRKRRQLGGEHLDEIFHDVGEGVDVGLVGELEELLHNGGDALLHAGTDNVVSDKGLQGEGCGHTDRQGRVCHAVEDVAVDGEEVVLVLEVELLELLDRVASPRTQVALGAREVGENVADEEVLDLVGDGALLAQDDRSQGTNHSQSAFLGNVVLLVVRRLLVLVDDRVDELEDLERLLSPVLSQADEEVGGGNVGGRGLFVKVEFPVEVFIRLVLELLNVLLGQAEDGENEMRHQVLQMRLEVVPHLLGAHRLVEEDKRVRQTRSAEPGRLRNPLLNLGQVVLEDLGRNRSGKLLGETDRILVLGVGDGLGVAVSSPSVSHVAASRGRRAILPDKEPVQVEVRPLLGLPPMVLLALV
ncbi:hypothetical protein ColTof3_13931 [Colletotrichum tofieldiae]|nr:hypothetical protein ColTof3_13931 [Colletotrichum tofieldiae]